MKASGFVLRSVCLAGVLFTAASSHAQSWEVTSLTGGTVTSINDLGQVAGTVGNFGFGSATDAIFYTGPNGQGTNILSLPFSGQTSVTVFINGSGQIAGSYTGLSSQGYFLTQNNGQNLQTTPYPGLTVSGINDSGQLTGEALNGSGIGQAFITGPNGQGVNVLMPLSTSAGLGNVAGINNSGQIAGTRVASPTGYFQDNRGMAFITGANGQGVTDLGSLGGGQSQANALNGLGQVVGQASTSDGSWHAFLTGPNGVGMTDLGALGGTFSAAQGVNNLGQVVGYVDTASGRMDAFITGPNGQGMQDLNSMVTLADGSYLQQAVGINNLGQVIAYGADGKSYLLSPVPETGTLAMMAVGFAALAGQRRKYRARAKRV